MPGYACNGRPGRLAGSLRVLAFAIYAVLVWYLAARWRRRLAGFASVAAGLAVLVATAWLHIRLSVWTHGRIYLPVLQALLYPYIVLVGVVGVYVTCLPRAARPMHCSSCDYDLAGLGASLPRCPECGLVHTPVTRGRRATRAPRAEPGPAFPRSPATAGPAVCLSPRAE